MDIKNTRIPVTLLTGFLGAGKTTLLNHLIKDENSGRIAVIMNEFGAAGLDHDLIEESTEETVLMQSGCLCCTFRGDISTTLSSLLSRKTSGELSFDRVVIETTGIAEPGPILQTLSGDELIKSDFYMDGVVTLVDAATGPDTLDTHMEAVNQIAMADLIVLSKSDLVTSDELERFEAKISSINNLAQQVRADHGSVPVDTLFGLSATDQDGEVKDISKWVGKEVNMTTLMSSHAQPQGRQEHKITSVSMEFVDPIPGSIFDYWLDTLIALNGPDILRMKGIVHVEGMECPFVFHGVQHIFDTPVPLENWSGEDTTSRIAVIARNISKEDLAASLEVLRVQPNGVGALPEELLVQAAATPF